MDIIRDLQRAIEYIENHLTEEITYEDAARHIYVSNYHFHRTFTMIAGVTPGEYIRNRRLSMAGQELSMSDAKVIDVALKYGYESPESFSKAFSRFHGVSPSSSRKPGAKLKSFNRLVIKIRLEGGSVMDYRIEKKETFKLIAKVSQFDNESVSQEGNTEIPDFWKACSGDGTFDVLKAHGSGLDIYGACGPISSESKSFDYGIGMLFEGGEVPYGYRIWNVNSTLWAVFRCMGDTPECIGDTWNRIFSEFLPGSGYEMLDDTDFELYAHEPEPGCFCEIWIPVKKISSK